MVEYENNPVVRPRAARPHRAWPGPRRARTFRGAVGAHPVRGKGWSHPMVLLLPCWLHHLFSGPRRGHGPSRKEVSCPICAHCRRGRASSSSVRRRKRCCAGFAPTTPTHSRAPARGTPRSTRLSSDATSGSPTRRWWLRASTASRAGRDSCITFDALERQCLTPRSSGFRRDFLRRAGAGSTSSASARAALPLRADARAMVDGAIAVAAEVADFLARYEGNAALLNAELDRAI